MFYYDKTNKNKWLDEKTENCGSTNVEPKIIEIDRKIEYIYFDEEEGKWFPKYTELKTFYSINNGSEVEAKEINEYVTDIKPPEGMKNPYFRDGKWEERQVEGIRSRKINKIRDEVTFEFKGKKIFPSDSLVQLAFTGITLMHEKNTKKGYFPIGKDQIEVDSLKEAEELMDKLKYNNYIYHLKLSKLMSEES